jgi:hypothetical protein
LRLAYSAKRRAIQELEDFRRRRLEELQKQLAEQRMTYASLHPIIRNTEQSIAALAGDSPQLGHLRREARELAGRYTELGGGDIAGEGLSEPRLSRALPAGRPSADENPGAEYARTQMRFTTEKYEELLSRIDAARIELETAQAAFKYRYAVLNPPQLPKGAQSPSLPTVLLGGLLAGLALGVLAARVRDWRAGWILSTWQIERQLGIRVLAQGRWP